MIQLISQKFKARRYTSRNSMGLIQDTRFMMDRSSVSKLKISQAIRVFEKDVKKNGEGYVYAHLQDRVKYNLCCSRILQGNYSDWGGWEFRDDWSLAMKYGIKTIPFWDGTYTERLVVIGEQGVGDEIMFSSLLPECMTRAKEVVYACDKRLTGLFSRSFGIEVVTREKDARDDLLDDFTAYIPAGDLLPLFRRRKEDFPKKPFIKVDPERVKEFEIYRGRTGISWSGRHGRIDPMMFKNFNPLSLQYNEVHENIETPPIDLKNDLEGVFALVSVLSNVISVPTSVHHISGSLGVPTDILPGTEGVLDQLNWSVPLGWSPWYSNLFVHPDIFSFENKCGGFYQRKYF